MVESTRLESEHTGNRIVGSNPTLSAIPLGSGPGSVDRTRGLQNTEFHDLKVFFLYDWLASGKLTATGERSNWLGRHTLGSLPKALDRNFRDEGPFVVNFGFS